MKRIILAGGSGTRLHPITVTAARVGAGLPNYSAIDNPGDAWLLSPFIRAAFCRRLSETSAPILVDGFYNKHREALCPGYTEALRISGSCSVIKKATKHV